MTAAGGEGGGQPVPDSDNDKTKLQTNPAELLQGRDADRGLPSPQQGRSGLAGKRSRQFPGRSRDRLGRTAPHKRPPVTRILFLQRAPRSGTFASKTWAPTP